MVAPLKKLEFCEFNGRKADKCIDFGLDNCNRNYQLEFSALESSCIKKNERSANVVNHKPANKRKT